MATRRHTAREVEALVGRDSTLAAVAGYLAVQQSLSALDRLEVRGRDSAGLHLFVWNHGLSVSNPVMRRMLADRNTDPLFQNGSVRVAGQCLSFVYKAAKEIGELGDNTRAIFGRSYAAEPDVLIEQLKKDEAIAEADTLLLTVPNQLGVDYNAHVIEMILKHVAPGLGWR